MDDGVLGITKELHRMGIELVLVNTKIEVKYDLAIYQRRWGELHETLRDFASASKRDAWPLTDVGRAVMRYGAAVISNEEGATEDAAKAKAEAFRALQWVAREAVREGRCFV